MRIPGMAVWVWCVLLGGCAQIQLTERQLIRPDAPGTVAAARIQGAGISDLSVTGQGGAQLNGILLTQPDARSTVLYFGGNMFHVDAHGAALLPMLGACGTDVAVFDYRGYGRSTGMPTVENMRTDALAIFDALNARFPGRVIVHGQSLGSFMAAYLAQERPVLAAILETTATSAQDLAESQVPWYAWPFVRIDVSPSLRQIDNRTAALRFHAPTLVIAAGRDKMTPAPLGRKVFDAIPRQDKQFLLLEEAGHNDALEAKGAGDAYCKFVRDVSAGRPAAPRS